MASRSSREDERSFDELYRAVWPRAVRAAQKILGDAGRAEEAAQEAFVRAFVKWRTVSVHPAPEAWVLRVTMNVSLDVVRRKTPLLQPPDPVFIEDRIVDGMVVREALARLSPKQRAALAMRYFAGAEEEEIAVALKVSPGTVKTHLARGTRHLRAHLGAEEEDEGIVGPAHR